ncbi:MAG: N-acetyl-gamma-glutamyl-phosphate reductase [Ignavibacteriae bacterium]|nr:N-acetyl-gamma-glutamyl-phosphate reductase [Ignavibacteriota bacterium]
MTTQINVSIIGASGYSGGELLRLLSSRNDICINHVTAHTSIGKQVEDVFPQLAGRVELEFESFEAGRNGDSDVVFIALPSGEAMNIVPLLKSGERIIDLGGDFRLSSAEVYEQFYRHHHTSSHLLTQAVYGLPELNKELIAQARLVANPGCYPTSAILALLPALRSNLVASTGIVINSLSGTSGAGKSASLEMSFSEINENIRAYKIGTHQHIPEIEQALSQASGKTVSVSFVPHLVPMTRGIYTTIHADLQQSIDEQDLFALYKEYYARAPFVRIKQHIPQIKDVAYTNFCDIGFVIEKRTKKLIIISVLDNLLKGAAGQAMQNMNIMFGLPETEGFFPSSITNKLVEENVYV